MNRIATIGMTAVSTVLIATGGIADRAGRRLRQTALETADEQR
ncbi:MAG: hypothetical protein ACKV2O_04595 [Acidimicrobiales bacterium]